MFGTPELDLLEGLTGLSRDRLGGEGRSLVVEIRFDEEVVPDPLQIASRSRGAQRLFIRQGEEHERGHVVRIAETDSSFVRSVSGLDGLVSRGEIGADADVDELLGGGDLCLVHERKTTLHRHACQQK